MEEAFKLVHEGQYIYPTQEDTYESYLSQTYCNFYYYTAGNLRKNIGAKQCSLDTPMTFSSFLFIANSTLLGDWNKAIIMNQFFIQRTFKKYYASGFHTNENVPKCAASDGSITGAMKPLSRLWLFYVNVYPQKLPIFKTFLMGTRFTPCRIFWNGSRQKISPFRPMGNCRRSFYRPGRLCRIRCDSDCRANVSSLAETRQKTTCRSTNEKSCEFNESRRSVSKGGQINKALSTWF